MFHRPVIYFFILYTYTDIRYSSDDRYSLNSSLIPLLHVTLRNIEEEKISKRHGRKELYFLKCRLTWTQTVTIFESMKKELRNRMTFVWNWNTNCVGMKKNFTHSKIFIIGILFNNLAFNC